jgi:hypothetical protein
VRLCRKTPTRPGAPATSRRQFLPEPDLPRRRGYPAACRRPAALPNNLIISRL